jgi:hypothetical protein
VIVCIERFSRIQLFTTSNQLIEALHDLENKYQELIGGKKWAGVGHTGLLQGFLFKVSTEDPEQEIQDAHAYATIKKIPFEEWCKKYAICHHCGKKGHICPDCEKFRADVAAGKIKLNHQPRDNRQRGVREDYGHKPPLHKNFNKDPKAKARVSAFAVFFAGNMGNDNYKDVESPPDEKEENNHEPTEDQLAFLSMVGSLKE